MANKRFIESIFCQIYFSILRRRQTKENTKKEKLVASEYDIKC